MRKRVLTLAGLLTLAASLSGLAGCREKSSRWVPLDEYTGKGIPAYSDELRMTIGGYWCPEATEEQYRWLAESGINQIVIDRYSKTKGMPTSVLSWEEREKMLSLCDAYNISALMGLVYEEDEIKELTKYGFSEHPSFSGFSIDEPRASQMPWYGEQAKAMQEHFPSDGMVANLLGIEANYAWETATYDEYFDTFVKEIYANEKNAKTVSFDLYPLLATDGKEERLNENWLKCLEVLADKTAGLEGARFQSYIQSCSYGKPAEKRRLPDEKEIRFQIYVNFAYGVQAVTYFAYRMPGDGLSVANDEFYPTDSAIIDYDNQRTELYYGVKSVNEEILRFDNVYLSFRWQGVMATYGGNNENGYNANFQALENTLKGHTRIKSLQADEDLLTGVFRDGEGRDGFMFVNFTDPALNRTNVVSVAFKNADRALVYRYGEAYVVNLPDGVFRTELSAGDGQFVIPLSE